MKVKSGMKLYQYYPKKTVASKTRPDKFTYKKKKKRIQRKAIDSLKNSTKM